MAVARNTIALTMRAVPRLRGHGRVAALVNSMFLACGCTPMATAQMRLGYAMLIDTRSNTESYALYSGDYDTHKIRFLMSLMSRDSVFLDVGANVGFYTVPMARRALAAGGRVFAFEPHPANVARLRHNLGRNGLDAVATVLQFALSSAAGESKLTMREDFARGSETGNAAIFMGDDDDRRFPTVRISLAALDDLYGATIPRVDIIKLDIEGHEPMFMRGARRTLSSERPIIMTEVNKFYYRRSGIDLFAAIKDNLPERYGVYHPSSRRKLRLTAGDRFDTLTPITDFDICADIDTAFLIPDEKLPMALGALAG